MASNHSDQSSPRSESPLQENPEAAFAGELTSLMENKSGDSSAEMESEQAVTAEGIANNPQKELGLNQEGEAGPSTSNGARGNQTQGASGGGIDSLLQKQKQEIMFELRRMKLGERPVTGQGSREAVESFFTRLQQDHRDQPEEIREQHRPESVTVEVAALVERQPVSSLLQSARFRTNLESALRNVLTTMSPRPSPAPNQQSRGPVSRASGTLNPGAPTPPPMPTTFPQRANSSVVVQRQEDLPILPDAIRSQPQPRGPAWAQQWLAQLPQQENVDANISNEQSIQNILERNQQEEFIAEVSELVQRQLVSSSLTGNFRNTLEHMMENRLRDIDDGIRRQVQHSIRNLPRSGIPRNDFSTLGINAAFDLASSSDNLDNISVISATAAVAVPHIQNQAHSREMASVKTQLQELRNMMRLSFDLQLDIQRAIRQEVAAAVSSALSGSQAAASNTPRPQPSKSTRNASDSNGTRPISESHCLICIDNSVDSVLYQCGHMCVCYRCGIDLRSRNSHCPVCRAPIKDIIRAYRSNDTEEL